jgi:hypothetical protein
MSVSSGQSAGGRNLKFLTCASASEMSVITAVVSGSDHLYGGGPSSTSTSSSSSPLEGSAAMQQRCWEKVEAAVLLGPRALKTRHSEAFATRMTQSAVVAFQSSAEPDAKGDRGFCPGPPELLSTQQSCLRRSLQQGNGTGAGAEAAVRLVNSALWLSKYLLLSSASRSVANLQGLWADGPESAWNGDHHININQQMAYWPAHALGLGPIVAPPLSQFVEDLAREGTHTARDMYGCRGWVSHGFTDNMLNGGVRAGLMWSLCVTCKHYR